MTPTALSTAISEAERFLVRARALRSEHVSAQPSGPGRYYEPIAGGPVAAACRRASLDLTRALAELRR